MKMKGWFVREEHYENVKFCPMCGKENLSYPNDLWEWVCGSCGAWFRVR
jgi:transcription elongation factor Elf1